MADVIGRAVIEVAPDVTRFARTLTRDLNKAFRGFKKISVGVSVGSVRKAFVEVSKLNTAMRATIVGFTVLGGKAIAGGVLALAGTVADLAGALALIPAAAASAALVMGALKIGLLGVDDVFKALLKQDLEKFNEALEKLSPAAQKSLGVIKQFIPQLKDFKDAVQDALLGGLEEPIKNLLTNLLPRVKIGFVGIATEINKIGRSLIAFATDAGSMRDLDRVFKNTTESVKLLGPAFTAIAQILRDIVTVASDFLPIIAGSFTGAVLKARDFIAAARESGELGEFIAEGFRNLKQVVSIVFTLIKAIIGVFRAAQESGFGVLDTIQKIATSLEGFINSIEGREAFKDFFKAAGEAAQALGPVLKSLFLLFTSTIAPILANFAVTLSPAIVKFIDAIGVAFEKAAPGIEVFAEGFANFVETIAPVLPKIGELAGVIASVLGRALEHVAPKLEEFLSLLADQLIKIFEDPDLIDAIFDFISALGDFFIALIPLLPALADLAKAILPALVDIIKALIPVIEPIADIIRGIADVVPILSFFLTGLTIIFVGLVKIVAGLIELFTRFPELVHDAIGLMQEFLGIDTTKTALKPGAFSNIMDEFARTLGAAGNAVDVFEGRITASGRNIVEETKRTFDEAGRATLDFIGPLEEVGAAALHTGDVIGTGFTNARTVVEVEMKRIGEIVFGNVEPLKRAGTAAGIGYVGGLAGALGQAKINAQIIVNDVRDLLGDTSGFGAAGSALTRAFAAGMVGSSALAAVRAASNAVAGAAGSALPRSPAEVGPFSGRGWTPFRGLSLAKGFAQGISEGVDAVEQESLNLAKAASLSISTAQPPNPTLFSATGTTTPPPVVIPAPVAPIVDVQPEIRIFVDGKELRVIATEVINERERSIRRNITSGVGGAR